MNTFTQKLGTLALLTALVGCTKQRPPAQPTQNPDLIAHEQTIRSYLEIKKEAPMTNTSSIIATNTSSNTQTLPSLTLSFPLYTPAHPACFNTNHTSPFCTNPEHATIGKNLSETQKKHQAVQQAYRAAIAHNMRIGTENSNLVSYAQGLSNNLHLAGIVYTNLLERKIQIEQEQKDLSQKLIEEKGKSQRLGVELSAYHKQAQEEALIEKRIQAESILVQTLFATPGYTLPGNPLMSAELKGNRLERVTTYHFSFPRVLMTAEKVSETLAHLGATDYKPAHTEGAFSNWVHQAGLPLSAFPDYHNAPLQHDRGAALCKAYADSLSGPLPGIVTWTNAQGKLNILGTEKALNDWRGFK